MAGSTSTSSSSSAFNFQVQGRVQLIRSSSSLCSSFKFEFEFKFNFQVRVPLSTFKFKIKLFIVTVEHREIYMPYLYQTPPWGTISQRCLIGPTEKTRMNGLPYAEKYDDMLSCFNTIPERNRRTDGQNCYINIARQHSNADA